MNSQPTIFKCKHCQTPLGVTVENRLTVGALKVGEPGKSVTVECPRCGDAVCWRPERQTGELRPQSQAA